MEEKPNVTHEQACQALYDSMGITQQQIKRMGYFVVHPHPEEMHAVFEELLKFEVPCEYYTEMEDQKIIIGLRVETPEDCVVALMIMDELNDDN